jgi:hypothetical protein
MSRFEDALTLVEQVFQFQTASEIETHVRNWMAGRFPKDFIKFSLEETKGPS